MSSKSNLEIMHYVVRNQAEKVEMKKLDRITFGNRWEIVLSRSYDGGKTYRYNFTAYAANKADAVQKFRAMVNPTTLAMFEGFCMNHNAKMAGMVSFSTSCMLNPHCLERMKNGYSVCRYCFAAMQLKRQATNREKLERNTELVKNTVISESYIPIIDGFDKIRLEAFGDLQSWQQAETYMNIARANSGKPVALWTKNPQYLWQALEKNGFNKPDNLIVIYSSCTVNQPAANVRNLYIMPNGKPMIDKVFTVYTKEHATANKVNINCGARNCNGCGRCYSHDTETEVNEILK